VILVFCVCAISISRSHILVNKKAFTIKKLLHSHPQTLNIIKTTELSYLFERFVKCVTIKYYAYTSSATIKYYMIFISYTHSLNCYYQCANIRDPESHFLLEIYKGYVKYISWTYETYFFIVYELFNKDLWNLLNSTLFTSLFLHFSQPRRTLCRLLYRQSWGRLLKTL